MKPSRAIYDDANCAYADAGHPCHGFRWLQDSVADADWQLPEPFNGWSANAVIVFLGLNPSYDPREAVPRIGATFEDRDAFDRHRFDGDAAGSALLYRRYQQVGQLAVGEHFRLGVDALVLEVVRFRSAKSAGIDAAVLGHERPLTLRLPHDAAPRLIISNGSDAFWELRNLFPALAEVVTIRTPDRLETRSESRK